MTAGRGTSSAAEPPASVFISHASRDAELASRLCAALEADGCRCWIAPRDIPPAAPWPEAIATGVTSSRSLVVLLTERSMNSRHLLREVELAVRSGVPVIPVRIDATPLAAGLQYLLSSVQWVDVAGDPPQTQAAKVRAAVEGTAWQEEQPRVPKPMIPDWLRRRPATLAGLVAAAALLAGFGAWRLGLPPRTPPPDAAQASAAAPFPAPSAAPAAAPAPVPLPVEAVSLPFAGLLQTVWTGTPPSGGAERPALALDILAQRQGANGLVAVHDGDPLRSSVDRYVISVRPATPGHLYVFQIDSRGAVYWLFPRNDACKESTGVNPVAPGRIEIPGDGRGLTLDDVTGDEHVYAVFSNNAWPELEERLDATGRAKPAGRPLAGTLLAARSRGVAGTAELGNDESMVRIGDRELATPAAPMLLHQANGSTLVLDRWFRHE